MNMDIAVLGDIHSNHTAFQACFDYAVSKGITEFILLGDYISDCPYPQKTMKLVYAMNQYFKCTMVRGNREEYIIEHRKEEPGIWRKGSASGSLLYTDCNLTDRDIAFFEKLPVNALWERPGYASFEICHGSPDDTRELLYRDKRNTKKVMSRLSTNLLLHGHNHIQETYSYRDKTITNPGSVGLPWYNGGMAQMEILHSDAGMWNIENVRIEYDREEILNEFAQSGLMEEAPAWAAVTMHTIRTGIDINQKILLRAMRLCEEATGYVKWPDIPEKYWDCALSEFKIDKAGNDL